MKDSINVHIIFFPWNVHIINKPFLALLHRSLGKRVLSLISLSVNVDEDFFENAGALNPPAALLRPLRYPVAGEIGSSDQNMHGAGAHTDYGMITILLTDGLQG